MLSFEDIFTKIGGYLPLDISERLARKKFEFFICVSVSWFICSLKNGKIGYFTQFSMYLYQTWWKSYPGPISQINLNEIFIIGLCVCQLVNFFTEKWKSCIFCSIFKIYLSNWVDILPMTYTTDWLTKLNCSTVCLSVGSFVL